MYKMLSDIENDLVQFDFINRKWRLVCCYYTLSKSDKYILDNVKSTLDKYLQHNRQLLPTEDFSFSEHNT